MTLRYFNVFCVTLKNIQQTWQIKYIEMSQCHTDRLTNLKNSLRLLDKYIHIYYSSQEMYKKR